MVDDRFTGRNLSTHAGIGTHVSNRQSDRLSLAPIVNIGRAATVVPPSVV
jgi:hypothetical protein